MNLYSFIINVHAIALCLVELTMKQPVALLLATHMTLFIERVYTVAKIVGSVNAFSSACIQKKLDFMLGILEGVQVVVTNKKIQGPIYLKSKKAGNATPGQILYLWLTLQKRDKVKDPLRGLVKEQRHLCQDLHRPP